MKTGNVKNVAAFGKLVGICNDLGASYDPSKEALTTTALATLLEQVQQRMEAVTTAQATLTLAINHRQEKFALIYSLASRVVRALAASGGSQENLRDAKLITRKLSVRILTPVNKAVTSVEEGSTSNASTSYTLSRLDYDGKADTFASLIQFVQKIPAYAPNEADLKVTALKTFLVDLRNASKDVANATNALSNARISRNQVLFGKGGMYETSTAVKEYIRSVFGVRSEPAKELGKLNLAA